MVIDIGKLFVCSALWIWNLYL